jgi:histidinol-phosphate aminotransferase
MAYERPTIQRMHGYVPGKQPPSPDTIKLNTNENPYPPSPAVMQALTGIEPDSLRRYPEPMAEAFRTLAAKVHGVRTEEIVAVNGGDELLRMAITTFVEPGSPIGVLDPSYSLYPVLADIHGSPVVRVPSRDDFTPGDDFAQRMNDAGVQLAFLVNPHAPSGVLLPAQTISRIAGELRCVLLVDEAYVDFVDPELQHDLLPLLRKHDNVLFLRTLSKGYGLAGLRFGYGIGCESLIAPLLGKTRDSYNVDVIAQRLATAALGDRDYARSTWERVRAERTRLRSALVRLGFGVPESQSNFLLATLPSTTTQGARELLRTLEAGGVLVRHFDEPRIDRALRITVGTPAQNDKLLVLLAPSLR